MILYKRIPTTLNLTNTYYWVANESLGIVPGTASSTSWKVYPGDASPTSTSASRFLSRTCWVGLCSRPSTPRHGEEATTVYGGHYASNDTSKLSSSLTITTDLDRPELGVGPWMSNGTDIVDMALRLQSFPSTRGINPTTRLYYTGLGTFAVDGSKQEAFKAVFEDVGLPALEGKVFSTDCGSWVDIKGVAYGSLPLDRFVFQLDSKGMV
ncbi:uncharacterized protein K441DRAFT_679553 [Cenococcum geophilum 1.58]|uniref:uncharacterized protein n=1 Tax=Cenococcum geophilum 1.58 TaxID=794803 RepID=UPI00358F1ACE|nr:hypothetical protein K441DRAFT_679553 [Cenococcum geophilum 1.58]